MIKVFANPSSKAIEIQIPGPFREPYIMRDRLIVMELIHDLTTALYQTWPKEAL